MRHFALSRVRAEIYWTLFRSFVDSTEGFSLRVRFREKCWAYVIYNLTLFRSSVNSLHGLRHLAAKKRLITCGQQRNFSFSLKTKSLAQIYRAPRDYVVTAQKHTEHKFQCSFMFRVPKAIRLAVVTRLQALCQINLRAQTAWRKVSRLGLLATTTFVSSFSCTNPFLMSLNAAELINNLKKSTEIRVNA